MHKRKQRRQGDEPALARDIAGAAERLGLGTSSVRRLLQAGLLRGVKVGRRTLIPDAELERFLAENIGRQVRL